MMEEIVNIANEMEDSLPIKHQFWKLILAATAGFVASQLTKKGYDASYNFFANRKGDTSAEA